MFLFTIYLDSNGSKCLLPSNECNGLKNYENHVLGALEVNPQSGRKGNAREVVCDFRFVGVNFHAFIGSVS